MTFTPRNELLEEILQAILSGGGTPTAWGGITGDILNQTDLQVQFSSVKPNNKLVINDIDDLNFYAPVSNGRHQIPSGFVLEFGAPVETPNGFAGGANSFFTANNLATPFLNYTGTDPMFLLEDSSFFLFQFGFLCPNADIFDYKSPLVTTSIVGINQVSCFACQGFGVIDDPNQLFIDTFTMFNAQQGIVLSGSSNWEILSLTRVRINSLNPAFVGLDFGSSVHRTVEVDNFKPVSTTGSIGVSGLSNGANMTSGFVASVTNSELTDVDTPLQNITIDDIRFTFKDNAGIGNSTINANPYLTQATTVTINTIGTYEKINAGNWSSTNDSRISVSVDGDAVNLLEQPIRVQVNASVTLEKVGGGADLVTARLVYNDDPSDPQSVITELGTENNNPTNIGFVGLFDLQPGDGVSMYVANQDSTSNITVSSAKISILRLL